MILRLSRFIHVSRPRSGSISAGGGKTGEPIDLESIEAFGTKELESHLNVSRNGVTGALDEEEYFSLKWSS